MSIPPDLALDERRATALPQDWPEDFGGPTTHTCCVECGDVFEGKPTRSTCRICAGQYHEL